MNRIIPLLCCILFTLLSLPARADDPCKIHLILFVPSDVQPPTGYQPRMNQIVNYTDAFFLRELKRRGHNDVVSPFDRRPDGRLDVMLIRGKNPTAEYKPVPLRAEVMDHLRALKKINDDRQIWWIFAYAGEPPRRFAAYLGGYGVEIGGWAICNFDTTPGRIDPNEPLGSDYLEKLTLKGMIHELGHAFQLPHIGPLKSDGVGNTLMGPTHANYRRVMKTLPQRVFLSEAEAAMLANHPAFRGRPDKRGPLPRVEVQGMKYTPRNNTIVVSGRLQSSQRANYVFVADESEDRPGEYWTKTYVGNVQPDGSFQVIVSEPSRSSGALKTWFAFDSGAQTGDGKSRGRESGITQPYTFSGQRWTFK